MLKRLKGALAMLAGCAALDPLCARRSDVITSNGRMRRATVRRGFEVEAIAEKRRVSIMTFRGNSIVSMP